MQESRGDADKCCALGCTPHTPTDTKKTGVASFPPRNRLHNAMDLKVEDLAT